MNRSTVIALIAAMTLLLQDCSRKPVVGRVLGREITADEFAARYAAYLDESGDRDNAVVREKILTNMLNEILILDDVRRQGFDTDSVTVQKEREIRLQAILDDYAKLLTTDTLNVSEGELREEFRASNTRVNARFVYGRTRDAALALKKRLEAGESFQTIAREVFADRTLADDGGSVGFFGYDEMERAFQDAAFVLPVGRLSDPVKLEIGFAIIRVDARVETPLKSEYDYAKAKQKLHNAIYERKVKEILERKGEGIRATLDARFDSTGLASAFRYWTTSSAAPAQARESDIPPEPVRALPLLKFRGGTWTVGEFLDRAEFMRSRDRRKIRTPEDIRSVALGLATRDVLFNEAAARGVEKDPRVQKQVDRVREEYLMKRWRSSVLDSVGRSARWDEDSLTSVFANNRELYQVPPMRNVAQIVLNDSLLAARVLARLNAGANFSRMAHQYSLVRQSAERGGVLGFASREMFGRLGPLIFDTPPGKVIGPVAVDPFWALLKVVATAPGRPKTYNEAREDIVTSLLPARQEKSLRAALGALQKRGNLRIDQQALAAVVVPSH
jgi:parvulin-like peptidyl-prolyl isomerase